MSQKRSPKDLLADFTELGDGQHWYKPSHAHTPTETTTTSVLQPDLIIFCAWAFAAPKHILKYVVQYRTIYPDSQILLLQNSLANLAWTPDYIQTRALKPSVFAIQEFLKTRSSQDCNGTGTARERPKDPIVLIHAFSNGGGHLAVQLAQAYRETLQKKFTKSSTSLAFSPELPISALILDSCPGKADFSNGISSAMSSVPKTAPLTRVLFRPVAYLVISCVQAADYLGVAENITNKIWRCLNDPDGAFLLRRGGDRGNNGSPHNQEDTRTRIVPRTYIYSTRDELVRWQQVHDHAQEARDAARGNVTQTSSSENEDVLAAGTVEDMIRLEGFPGSAHVNHVTVDPGRYWRIVGEILERAC